MNIRPTTATTITTKAMHWRPFVLLHTYHLALPTAVCAPPPPNDSVGTLRGDNAGLLSQILLLPMLLLQGCSPCCSHAFPRVRPPPAVLPLLHSDPRYTHANTSHMQTARVQRKCATRCANTRVKTRVEKRVKTRVKSAWVFPPRVFVPKVQKSTQNSHTGFFLKTTPD